MLTATPHKILKTTLIDTKLAAMMTIADDEGIYLLEFTCGRGLEQKIERLRLTTKANIMPGSNGITQSMQAETIGKPKAYRAVANANGAN
jgi:AraC family transcriptional regulator, regulatory protein of adaptative response / methylated-DNA-[protein]-cysteine methyltransferase